MDQETRQQRRFDLRFALSWLGLILLGLAIVALLWYGGKVFLLVFAGILVAVVIRAPTGFLVRVTGMPDKLAYALVLLLLLAVLVGFGMLVGPKVLNQAGQFSERVPTIVDNARDYLESRSWGRWIVDQLGLAGGGGDAGGQAAGGGQELGAAAGAPDRGAADAGAADAGAADGGAADAGAAAERALPPSQPGANGGPGAGAGAGQGGQEQAAAAQPQAGGPAGGDNGGGMAVASVASRVTGITSAIMTTLAHLALVVVLGLFLAVNPGLYRRGLVRLFPAEAQQRAGEVVDELGRTLTYWLMGQLALMFITGLLTGIGLLILGIPLALALAFFVFLMEFIPFVGPIIGFIPILIMAATKGGSTVLWALVLYLAVQQIEGNILTPLIQQRAVALPPALTVSAVFLGGALFGPIGVILATPLIAVVYVLVKMLYVHDSLGQRVDVPGKTEAV
ncbi:MAG TPA: AI-2E family transporter [Trueperaceae bacterium]